MRQKINISTHLSTSLKAVYESFIISQTSRGISDATITNYHNHLRGIAKHIDIDMPFDELSKRHFGAGDGLVEEVDSEANSSLLSSLSHNNSFLAFWHCVFFWSPPLMFLRFCVPQSLCHHYTNEPIQYNRIGSQEKRIIYDLFSLLAVAGGYRM